jgi:hypothetical protein
MKGRVMKRRGSFSRTSLSVNDRDCGPPEPSQGELERTKY